MSFSGWWGGLQNQRNMNLERERLRKDMESQALRDALMGRVMDQREARAKIEDERAAADREENRRRFDIGQAMESSEFEENRKENARKRLVQGAELGLTPPDSDAARNDAAIADVPYTVTGETPLPGDQAGPPEPTTEPPTGLAQLYKRASTRPQVQKALSLALTGLRKGPKDPAFQQGMATLQLLAEDSPDAVEALSTLENAARSRETDDRSYQLQAAAGGRAAAQDAREERAFLLRAMQDAGANDLDVKRAGAAFGQAADSANEAAKATAMLPKDRQKYIDQLASADLEFKRASLRAKIKGLKQTKPVLGSLSVETERWFTDELRALEEELRQLNGPQSALPMPAHGAVGGSVSTPPPPRS